MKRVGLAAALLVSAGWMALAAPPRHAEYDIKAAFLYNFAKFVEWPAEALQNNDAFVIGILGSDPFGNRLDEALKGKTVHEKKLVVKRVSSLEAASKCQVLFISASKESELKSILDAVQGSPVLTVSDMRKFIERGGTMDFSVEDRKIRFGVNVQAAEKAGLKVSSQLLKLAKPVISRGLEMIPCVWLFPAPIQSAKS